MQQFEKIYLYRRIVKAKLFIDNHYADDIDLDNVSGQAHFSKFHFIRLFKLIYGYTPNNYLVKTRIEKAKILLGKGNPVLQTSIMVGFHSPTSFAGTFKKITGVSPSAFQKEQLIKKTAMQANPLRFVPNCFAATHGWTEPQY